MRKLIVILLFAIGCNESRNVGFETLGYDYYPIDSTTARIYQVEEIRYLIAGFDTLNYQLRETIFDTISTNNQITYLLRREVREDEMQEWESDSVWAVTQTSNFLAINENGIPLMKLTFPVNVGNTWDGNSLNAREEQVYSYQALENPTIDSIDLKNHIRVIIADIPQNIVERDERNEVYVRGIGLVEKNYLSLKYCTTNCNEVGEIIAGRSLIQQLIAIEYE